MYLQTDVSRLEKEHSSFEIESETESMTYYRIRQQLEKLAKQLENFIHLPKYCLPYMQPGRLVKVWC